MPSFFLLSAAPFASHENQSNFALFFFIYLFKIYIVQILESSKKMGHTETLKKLNTYTSLQSNK